MRTTAALIVQVTKSIRPSTKPNALKRSLPSAPRSSNSITCGSKNTLAAVQKSRPCFFRLACSLASSHSKSIACPSPEYTDIQYSLQERHEGRREPHARSGAMMRAASSRERFFPRAPSRAWLSRPCRAISKATARVRQRHASSGAFPMFSAKAEGARRPARGNERADAAPSPCSIPSCPAGPRSRGSECPGSEPGPRA